MCRVERGKIVRVVPLHMEWRVEGDVYAASNSTIHHWYIHSMNMFGETPAETHHSSVRVISFVERLLFADTISVRVVPLYMAWRVSNSTIHH